MTRHSLVLAALGMLGAACAGEISGSAGDATPGGGDGGHGGVGDAAAAPDAGPVTAAQLTALLGACDQLPGTTDFATHAGGTPSVPICRLPGALYWKADMAIDCDGGRSAECMADPAYSAQTSASDSLGKPLDASTVPYVVIPIPSNGFDPAGQGIHLGQVFAVIHGDLLAYGVYGDAGPKGDIGEASYAMAVLLGVDPNPVTGGVDSGVSYIVFTGADANVTKNEDHAEAVAIGEARAAKLVAGP